MHTLDFPANLTLHMPLEEGRSLDETDEAWIWGNGANRSTWLIIIIGDPLTFRLAPPSGKQFNFFTWYGYFAEYLLNLPQVYCVFT